MFCIRCGTNMINGVCPRCHFVHRVAMNNFCEKCGSRKINGFCPYCRDSATIKYTPYSIFVFLCTIFMTIIIRMLAQEKTLERSKTSWLENDYVERWSVPASLQVVMIALLCMSVSALIWLCASKKCKLVPTILMIVGELIVGLILTFAVFS